jgi:hypothetical protein
MVGRVDVTDQSVRGAGMGCPSGKSRAPAMTAGGGHSGWSKHLQVIRTSTPSTMLRLQAANPQSGASSPRCCSLSRPPSVHACTRQKLLWNRRECEWDVSARPADGRTTSLVHGVTLSHLFLACVLPSQLACLASGQSLHGWLRKVDSYRLLGRRAPGIPAAGVACGWLPPAASAGRLQALAAEKVVRRAHRSRRPLPSSQTVPPAGPWSAHTPPQTASGRTTGGWMGGWVESRKSRKKKLRQIPWGYSPSAAPTPISEPSVSLLFFFPSSYLSPAQTDSPSVPIDPVSSLWHSCWHSCWKRDCVLLLPGPVVLFRRGARRALAVCLAALRRCSWRSAARPRLFEGPAVERSIAGETSGLVASRKSVSPGRPVFFHLLFCAALSNHAAV